MEIGGMDVYFETDLTAAEMLLRSIKAIDEVWDRPLVEFGFSLGYPEAFVYRDMESYSKWEELGADENNEHTMIYLIPADQRLLIAVVDDREESVTKRILSLIKERLSDRPSEVYKLQPEQ